MITEKLLKKLSILGASAKYDACASSFAVRGGNAGTAKGVRNGHPVRPLRGGAALNPLGALSASGVCHSFTPDGRCISLFKVLMTNTCEKNCLYCMNRSSCDEPRRTAFTPEELAELFVEFYRRNYVEGLFLSSGIAGGAVRSMDRLLGAVELIRERYHFKGYIHLKILPGAEEAQIERAMQLAERVSVNMEAPSAERLLWIAPEKSMAEEIEQAIGSIHTILQNDSRLLGAGHTTQYVVGASGESDAEILGSATKLYRTRNLRRAYYSAYSPPSLHTPLSLPSVSLRREHRLYQSDFLLRQFGFSFEEIPFDQNGHLDLEEDPKLIWARRRQDLFPLEVNRAGLEELLRVPGIGPVSARRILSLRRQRTINSLDLLKRSGAVVKRARDFLTLAGRYFPAPPSQPIPTQLSLFEV